MKRPNKVFFHIVYRINHTFTNMSRHSSVVVYSLGGGEGGTNVPIHQFDLDISFSNSANSYYSKNDKGLMYFYVSSVREFCPACKMNCFEFHEMHLTSPLFFVLCLYLHPDANIGVHSSTIIPSSMLFISPD